MVCLGSLITQLFRFSFTLFNWNSKINNALRKLDRNLKKSTSFKGGGMPGHVYVDIFRKGSVGLFPKHFAGISESKF